MKLEGNPTDIAYYPGQERFSDGEFNTVTEWTPELALRLAGADKLTDRQAQVDQVRDALDDDLLPPGAVAALVAAGWTELAE